MKMLSFFKPKTIQPDRFLSKSSFDFLEVMKNQTILTKTILSLSTLIDENMIEMAMWIKDNKHRYVYGNQKLRNDLFNGVSLTSIIGKTDIELADPECVESSCQLIEYLSPEDLPNINNFLADKTRICNLTDVITKSFNITCYFIETVEDNLLFVKKTPMDTGSVGSYLEISNRNTIFNVLAEMIENKEAYKIDNLPSYYITPESHSKIMELVLNGKENHTDSR